MNSDYEETVSGLFGLMFTSVSLSASQAARPATIDSTVALGPQRPSMLWLNPPSNPSGKVLGVEPDPRMAQFARQAGVAVEVAALEDWDPAGRAFDAVVAGQAWHWVDPVAGAAKAAQVLRPGGRLALFWHVFELPPDVAEAFVAVYQRVLPDSPFNLRAGTEQALEVYQVLFTKAADGIREVGGFSDPEQWRFDWERSYTRDEWLDQLPTFGPFTRLPSDTLAEVLQGVGATIDAMGGRVTVRYTTVAVTAARTGAA